MFYLRRDYLILIFVLFLLLILISWQIRTGGETTLLHSVFFNVTAPFLKGGYAVAGGVSSTVSRVAALHKAQKENRKLEKKIKKIKTALQFQKIIQKQNLKLRKLLDYKRNFTLDTIAAHVISRDVTNRYSSLIVSKGRNHGVKKNMAVVTPDGIAGRVVQVSRGSCKVQLISDSGSGVAAFCQRTEDNTLIIGENGEILEAKYIHNTSTIHKGDILITSGYDGIYPEGLIVGTVTSSEKGDFGEREVKVNPAVELTKIRNVLIVK